MIASGLTYVTYFHKVHAVFILNKIFFFIRCSQANDLKKQSINRTLLLSVQLNLLKPPLTGIFVLSANNFETEEGGGKIFI